jgi:hypothetical protein
MAKKWYEILFTDCAETYDKGSFTQGPLGGWDFIESDIGDALTPDGFKMMAVAVKS